MYHHACLVTIVPELLPQSFPCKECQAIIDRSTVVQWTQYHGYERIPCPECGDPRPVVESSCERCKLPVFPVGHHCVLTIPLTYVFSSSLYGKGCYHEACYRLYFEDQLNNSHADIFGYEAEYRSGQLISESKGDEHAQRVLRLRCERARQGGKQALPVKSLNGPFISFWGYEIPDDGIAKKSIGLRNLSGSESEIAKKIQGWGYSVFVSRYHFTLMVRV